MHSGQTLVHLTHQLKDKWCVACIQTPTEYRINGVVLNHPGYQLSGDPRAVTCPECKKSEVFKQILDRLPK